MQSEIRTRSLLEMTGRRGRGADEAASPAGARCIRALAAGRCRIGAAHSVLIGADDRPVDADEEVDTRSGWRSEFLMKRTLPSPRPMFTPPGCMLRAWPPTLFWPGLPTVVPWLQLQGMPSWPRLGNCAAKVQHVWFSSPPSSQFGGPETMKFEFGPELYDRASQQRLEPPKPIAQTPRPSEVTIPARISATKIVFERPSVTAASVTP